MYVDDVALGMIRAVEVYDRNEVVNISSGVETTIREVCEHLAALTAFTGTIEWDATKPGGQLRRCFDISKSRRELQFVPQTDIRTGLAQTVEWYRANQTDPDLRR